MEPSDRVWRERALRGAVLAGDEQAWRTWYEEAYAGLYAYVAWRCAGRRDLIEEVLQDAWLTAVRRIRHFNPGRAPFADWLRGIAANVLRNHFRRRERRARITRPLDHEPAESPEAAQDRAEQIARALASLPERYEAVLRAKYLDGKSVAEIAQAGNESPKAVESLLTRARQAFRDAYEKES